MDPTMMVELARVGGLPYVVGGAVLLWCGMLVKAYLDKQRDLHALTMARKLAALREKYPDDDELREIEAKSRRAIRNTINKAGMLLVVGSVVSSMLMGYASLVQRDVVSRADNPATSFDVAVSM